MTAPTTPPPPGGDPADRFKDRMDAFGREAQAAGDRLSRDPNVVVAGTWFVRAIGLVLIVVGLWFTGLVTLGYDLPALDWELVWPIALVLVGAFVIASGLTRRR